MGSNSHRDGNEVGVPVPRSPLNRPASFDSYTHKSLNTQSRSLMFKGGRSVDKSLPAPATGGVDLVPTPPNPRPPRSEERIDRVPSALPAASVGKLGGCRRVLALFCFTPAIPPRTSTLRVDAPRGRVPSAATTGVDPPVHPHLNPASSEPIIDPMNAIKDSLASLTEATALAERIPFISPVAGLLIETLRIQDDVKQHKEKWDVVKVKVRKLAFLVSNVGMTCLNDNLQEYDLPRVLRVTFQSLETELVWLKRALKQSNEMGVIKRIFLGQYLGRKIKKYDNTILNLLQLFQAALAFNPHFVQFAERLEMTIVNVKSRYNEDQTPLHVASQLGQLNTIRSLIGRGADLNAENEDKETPLFLVSRNGNEEAAKLLLLCKADAKHRNLERKTPLHEACENGHYAVVGLLLTFRADVNANDVHDWTPLHLASRAGKSTVVRVLLQGGADVNALNDSDWTPLHMAAQTGHADVVELLLTNHADVNAQEVDNETALHLAAYYGYVGVAELLINRGADLRIINNKHNTALDLARTAGHQNVAQLLEAEAVIRSRRTTTL